MKKSRGLDVNEMEGHVLYGDNLYRSFIEAIEKGESVERISRFLRAEEIDPSINQSESLRVAVRGNFLHIVKVLLDDGRADPSINSNICIRVAAHLGYTDIVKLLLADRRVDPTEKDNSALRLAAIGGNDDIVLILLNDRRVQCSISKEVFFLYKRHISVEYDCF